LPLRQPGQPRTAQHIRHATLVVTGLLQQVIRKESDGCLGQQLLRHRLAVDARLQGLERRGLRGTFRPDQQFAVQHRAVGQAAGRSHDFRETFGDQFFTARPQPHPPGTPNQLRADAVVLPFNQPQLRWPQRGVEFGHGQGQRVRQKEGIGLTGFKLR